MNPQLVTNDRERPLVHGLQANMLDVIIRGLVANTHGKALVVGVIGGNFTAEITNHPQIILWETEEAERREVPQAVRVVMFTRFISHHVYDVVKTACEKRGIVVGTATMGIGQIKALLRPLVDAAQKEKEILMRTEHDASAAVETTTPVPPATTALAVGHTKRGVLKKFVLKHDSGKPVAEEGPRLYQMAVAQGLPTTEASVMNRLWVLRKQQRDKAERQAARETRRSVPKVEVLTKVVETPAQALAPAKSSGLLDLNEDDAIMLKNLDDAVAAIQLARELIARRSESRQALKDLLSKL